MDKEQDYILPQKIGRQYRVPKQAHTPPVQPKKRGKPGLGVVPIFMIQWPLEAAASAHASTTLLAHPIKSRRALLCWIPAALSVAIQSRAIPFSWKKARIVHFYLMLLQQVLLFVFPERPLSKRHRKWLQNPRKPALKAPHLGRGLELLVLAFVMLSKHSAC